MIVVNATKIMVSGKKLGQKIYYRHTSYPGGLKERKLSEMLNRFPTRLIEHSVKGMLPKSKLGRQLMKRLKVYAGDSHPHQAQVTGSLKAKEPIPQPAPKDETPPPRQRRKKENT